MPRSAYQYETSPRKYEPEYTYTRTIKKQETTKKSPSKAEIKKRLEKERARKAEEKKKKSRQLIVVFAIFGMLLAVSYREISIMEMFNQKKELENQLSLIQKEDGQVEKNIKEVESTLDWNKIKQVASEQLGMQVKEGTTIELEKSDNVETKTKYIQDDKTNIIEQILEKIINKK